MGAGPRERAESSEDRAAERGADDIRAPDRLQPFRRAIRVGRDEHTVDGADGRANHKVGPDPRVGECGEHANLVRAEHPTSAQYKGGAVDARLGAFTASLSVAMASDGARSLTLAMCPR